MNNFYAFLSPEEYFKLGKETPQRSLKTIRRLARNNGSCENCDEHVWRLADTGLCFSCTTGEADASDDYEIGEPY